MSVDLSNREGRSKLAKETLEILRNEGYNYDNRQINLKEELKACIEGSQVYTPKDLDKLRAEISPEHSLETIMEVTPETSLAAARRLGVEEGREGVACLNFASAKHPGGGFLSGARAQEENLTRSSALYPTLIKHEKSYYKANIPTRGGIYTDHLIWSPSVPVFRDDNGSLLPHPYTLSFITAPCVNAGAAKPRNSNRKARERKKERKERGSKGESSTCSTGVECVDDILRETMIRRIDNVLGVAYEKKQRTLVLGAWGCGAFGNSPKMISELFAHFLTAPDAKYKNVFEKIVFAILVAKKSDEENLTEFQKVFSANSIHSD